MSVPFLPMIIFIVAVDSTKQKKGSAWFVEGKEELMEVTIWLSLSNM